MENSQATPPQATPPTGFVVEGSHALTTQNTCGFCGQAHPVASTPFPFLGAPHGEVFCPWDSTGHAKVWTDASGWEAESPLVPWR